MRPFVLKISLIGVVSKVVAVIIDAVVVVIFVVVVVVVVVFVVLLISSYLSPTFRRFMSASIRRRHLGPVGPVSPTGPNRCPDLNNPIVRKVLRPEERFQ